jgi:hypothetical protein
MHRCGTTLTIVEGLVQQGEDSQFCGASFQIRAVEIHAAGANNALDVAPLHAGYLTTRPEPMQLGKQNVLG